MQNPGQILVHGPFSCEVVQVQRQVRASSRTNPNEQDVISACSSSGLSVKPYLPPEDALQTLVN